MNVNMKTYWNTNFQLRSFLTCYIDINYSTVANRGKSVMQILFRASKYKIVYGLLRKLMQLFDKF